MLTSRQRDILTFLINRKSWVRTEELARFFSVSRKTILKDIRMLNEFGVDEIVIKRHQKKGYYLILISDHIRGYLIKHSTDSEVINTLSDRPTQFILFLLFNNSPISLQQFSELFYISKTAVATDFETIKRWLGRNHFLSLEISAQGFSIQGAESYKRIYMSNLISTDRLEQLPLVHFVADKYKKYLPVLSNILTQFFIDNDYLVSDLDFNRMCRYLSISIVRSELGYVINEEISLAESSSKLTQIYQPVKNNTGYCLMPTEFVETEKLLSNLKWDRSSNLDDCTYLKVDEQLSQINQLFKINYVNKENYTNEITSLIISLKNRQKEGITTLNLWNDSIIQSNLLAAYFAYQLVSYQLSMPIDKEISRVVLLINMYIESNQLENLSVLIISKSEKEMARNLENELKKHSINYQLTITQIPKYLFDNAPSIIEDYQLVVTTEEEVMFSFPDCYLLDALPTDISIRAIFLDYKQISEERARETIQKIMKTVSHKEIVDNEAMTNRLTDFMGEQTSHFFINKTQLIVMKLSIEATTSIDVFDLTNRFEYQGKRVKRVILLSCDELSPNIKNYFLALSELTKSTK